ncbi:glutamine synthetase 1, mitochondrial-like [Condylostylus longicornis]|uniref:glutamine synthetase 1, mitochondrial-like n=1 Tax=Condylostylus longicornis TaxID=2530218 RepID=UPI00244E3904|nr:glutamine synthetase 1, mitochondrial-like [Condylostylus longicornis]
MFDIEIILQRGILDKKILNRYRRLQIPENKIQVTYLWIDGISNIRIKDKIIDCIPQQALDNRFGEVDDLPVWQYDGGSTYQASADNSDVVLIPKVIYKDPFKAGNNDIIALCETFHSDGSPTATNKRKECTETFCKYENEKMLFGFEQEYTVLGFGGRPFGWPIDGFPKPQGPYYCGVGGDKVFLRDLMESHIMACLYAGIDLHGTNAEVMPSQLEYQTGPTFGIKAADDLWVSRYILQRITEDFGLTVTFDPKPIPGDWNGAGCHTNFSSKSMRNDGGINVINEIISKLSKKHKEHLIAYDPHGGLDNKRRLLGTHETSSIDTFTFGISDRRASVRIPLSVSKCGKGYIEDRRPSSNCDPYSVTNAIITTIFGCH